MPRRSKWDSQASTSPALLARPNRPQNISFWPVSYHRVPLPWFPARHRLIGLVRSAKNSFVLPPAVVRKASWRD